MAVLSLFSLCSLFVLFLGQAGCERIQQTCRQRGGAVVLHGTSLIFGLGVRQHRARCCTAWHKPAIWIRRSAKERQKKKEEEEEEEEEEEATIDVLDHS